MHTKYSQFYSTERKSDALWFSSLWEMALLNLCLSFLGSSSSSFAIEHHLFQRLPNHKITFELYFYDNIRSEVR